MEHPGVEETGSYVIITEELTNCRVCHGALLARLRSFRMALNIIVGGAHASIISHRNLGVGVTTVRVAIAS